VVDVGPRIRRAWRVRVQARDGRIRSPNAMAMEASLCKRMFGTLLTCSNSDLRRTFPTGSFGFRKPIHRLHRTDGGIREKGFTW